MDSFNILIHVDSDNLIINDNELIINKKIGSFLNVKNYEVCLTHVIPNHQIITDTELKFIIYVSLLTICLYYWVHI